MRFLFAVAVANPITKRKDKAMNQYNVDAAWADEFINKIEKKLSVTSEEIGARFPYSTTDGKYEPFAYGKTEEGNGIFWWTNGFWGGIMWLAYLRTGKEQYRRIAEQCEERLDECFQIFRFLTHDVGFIWLPTAVKSWRLTGNERSKARALHAATVLAGRYNHRGGFIRAWEHDKPNRTIIDCMMNLPLLYWASEVTGDTRFRQVAEGHADTTLRLILRKDGSSAHMVDINEETGEAIEYPGGQGAFSGSSWSRGQAWAIYGFTQSYQYTGKQEYLDAAKRAAHYFIANIDERLVPDVDFRARGDASYVDTTAGVAAASGLLDLAKEVSDGERELYRSAAVGLLTGARRYCNFEADEQSILQHGVGAYGRAPQSIIYGDYYLLEALLKLSLGEKMLPW